MSLVKLVNPVNRYSKRKMIPLCAAGETCLAINQEVLLGDDPMTSWIFLSAPTTLLFAVGWLFGLAANLFSVSRLLHSHSAIHANSK